MAESGTQPEKPERERPLVLLTGPTGYIGSRLLLRLQQRNVPVRCLARKPDNLRTKVAVAGLLRGCLTPSRAWVGAAGFPHILTRVLERLVKSSDESTQEQHLQALSRLGTTAREGTSPSERFESGLHPWVVFLILPLFALANAGVVIDVASLGSAVALAVTAGLVLGKPTGIVLFSWIATKLGFARLPSGVNWKIMIGAGCLAGIGFTMSIFIASLALQGTLLDDGGQGSYDKAQPS